MASRLIVTTTDVQSDVSVTDIQSVVASTLLSAEFVLDPDSLHRWLYDEFGFTDPRPIFVLDKKADGDSFTLSESDLFHFYKVPESSPEIVVMNESLTRVVEYARTFTDAFTLDDNATVDAFVKDYFGNKGNVFGFADTQAFGVGKNLTDSFSSTEAIDSFDFGKGLADAQSFADNFSRAVQFQRTFTSTFVMDDAATVDAFKKDTSAGKTNIYTMGDVFARQVDYIRLFNDSFSSSESHAVSITKPVTPDSFNFTDTLSRVVSYVRANADSFSFADAVDSFAIGKGLADSQALSESHSSSVSLAKTDSTTLTEAPTQSVGLAKTDSFSFSDTDSRVVQFARTFTDAFSLDDAATVNAFAKDYSGNKPNIFNFADSQTFGVGKGLTDSFSFADDPDFDVSKGLSDSVSMTENFSYALFSNAAFNAAQINLSAFNE